MSIIKAIFILLFSFTCINSLLAQSGSMDWTQVTSSANWSARHTHTSVVFDNKIWVIGGISSSPLYRNDVWYSTNGSSWTQATSNAGWSARYGHTSLVFDNKIWVIGGYDVYGLRKNDVWYSTDGISWTRATETAMWPERDHHSSVVFDNKMWVLGGYSTGGYRNDIWYSTNGVNWTCATYSAPWSAREGHTSLVFDNKIWVIGGFSAGGIYRNDVWYSSDGVSWTEATSNAEFPGRAGYSSEIFGNKLWVIGGSDGSSSKNDVWYSTNGVNWISATTNAGWQARNCHTSVVYDSTIWVIGGYANSTEKNDVWKSEALGITMIYPNGNESLPSGSNQLIRWRKIGSGNPKYRLLFSRNGGTSYPDTIINNITAAETCYSWHLPVLNINTVRVKIQMLDTMNTVILQDASDANFTIQTTARIVQPNGGESWAGGTQKLIKWNTIGSDFARFRILLSRNSGSTYIDTLSQNVVATETTFNWIVPYSNLNTCRILVQILDTNSLIIFQKASDSNFTIDSDPPSIFSLLSPINGTMTNTNLTYSWNPANDNLGLSHYQLLISIPNDTIKIDSIFRTSIGYCANWRQATANAEWSGRYGHSSVIFDNKIWVFGGNKASGCMNDVWYSADGVNWTQAIANAGWSVRDGHTSGVFDNKMWVIGGWDEYTNKRDVWYSSDGINWTQATSSAGWSARRDHSSVVFDNKIWVIGGISSSPSYRNDVWYSTNGINWTQATDSASWSIRSGHSSVVFDNKMWVIGGDGRNDVWYSTDGINWTQATSYAGWSSRYGHSSVVFDNKIWVIGGYNGSGLNDVWYSSDGVNWNQASTSPGWSARSEQSTVVFNNKMWVIGGDANSYKNDVWYAVTAEQLLQIPEGLRSWYIKAFDRAGNWQRSAQTFFFTIDTSAPSVPVLITPTNSLYTQDSLPIFIWYHSTDNYSNVNHYQLQYAKNSSFTGGTSINVNDTSYQVLTGLDDTTYYWRVKAIDTLGNQSSWSSVWSFEIDTRIPNTTTLVSPINGQWLTNTSVVLNWSPVTFDAKSPVQYILQVDTNTTFTTSISDTTNRTSDTLTLLQDRYYWRVKAFDLAGNQGAFSSHDSFGVDNTSPSVPNLISPTANAILTDSFVRFYWNKSSDNVSGVRNYRIQIANNSSFISPIDTTITDTTILRKLRDTTYYWKVKSIDRANNESDWSTTRNFSVQTTGIEEMLVSELPITFSLSQIKPNPFSQYTSITYGVPYATKVKLSIYDITGNEICILSNRTHSPGWYNIRWDCRDNKGSLYSSGVYFVRLETDDIRIIKKILLFR
jgi:hypothetical protein